MARTFSLVACVLDMALSKLRALLLQGGEPLGVGLLAEGGAGPLEGRQHAGRVELGCPRPRCRQPAVDLMRCSAVWASPFSLARSPSTVDSSRSIWEMRVSTVTRRFWASLVRSCLDLVLVLQGGHLGHALAIDGAAALLERTFHAAILGHCLDALGVDLLGLAVELGLVLGVLGGQRRALGLEAGQLIGQRDLLVGEAGLAALRRGDALLLLVDGAAALFHLLDEVLLDLALRALRGLGRGSPAACRRPSSRRC